MFIGVEATGCPNVCRHCGVNGHPPHGSLYSMEDLYELSNEWGSLIYLHEPTAHPEFPEIFDRRLKTTSGHGKLQGLCGWCR